MIASLLAVLVCAGAFEHADSFDYADGSDGAPVWFTDSIAWQMDAGALVHRLGERHRTFVLLEPAPHGKAVVAEAMVCVQEAVNNDWAVAGVALHRDAGNYWHLALVEAPESEGRRHFVELQESLNGTWLATTAEGSRLTPLAREGDRFDWQYGRPYRLRLELTPGRIDGYVQEMDGTQRSHFAYALDAPAVDCGRPGLDCGGFIAAFDEFRGRVDQPVPAPEPEIKTIPPYDVAACEAIRGKATGFFHVEEIDGRWWFIDPAGAAFYAVGTDHIRYTGHWCQTLGYAPYGKVTQAKYGDETAWAEATAERLHAWGFNAVTAGHSPSMRYRGFAHTEFLSIGTQFSPMDDLCPRTTWTGFPNVFSPLWPRYCDRVARKRCADNADDPWLLGYFIDNELEWYGKSHREEGLFDEAWKKPADHTAKQAWVAFLNDALGDAAAFEKHWGVRVADFDALAAHQEPAPPRTERARAIAQDWVRLVAERYFKTAADAIRRYDPNHLVLGNRFAGGAPGIWDVAGRHCDVVTFNMYPRVDVDLGVPDSVIETIETWQKEAGRPLMITEWSFPALDSGLPCKHGAGMRVDTQAQRTRCFEYFQTVMFSLPFMVGSDFFMFVDEPALGISDTFPEDSNYGLIDGEDQPYPELTAAATALNARVYDLHRAGRVPRMPAFRLAEWLSVLPAATPGAPPERLTLSAGALHLEGPVDGEAWRLTRGEMALGDWHPLIHQDMGQHLWVASDTGRITAVRENDTVIVVDMELARTGPGAAVTEVAAEGGAPAPQRREPRRFRSAWRFWVPKADGAWFASQCLWVENTDTTAWRLEDIFHYLAPSIGGSREGDEPLTADVPNYYLRGSAWIDEAAGAGAGCWYADEKSFRCHYWTDEGGGYHSDLSEPCGVTLEPGARYEGPGALAFFFPIEAATPAAFRDATGAVKGAVAAPRPG
ncbi:MAG: hypothetical protein JXR94_21305 [Candidatus Hydrogenedentes bacterium]|nr:hypothetical protein [Candidatus Hydrogenedentota bacterium]